MEGRWIELGPVDIKQRRMQVMGHAGRELKVDLDRKLVIPNINELTCIQTNTILVFQQSKTLVAIY